MIDQLAIFDFTDELHWLSALLIRFLIILRTGFGWIVVILEDSVAAEKVGVGVLVGVGVKVGVKVAV